MTKLPRLPLRPEDGHKGTFGRLLIVAGHRGQSGAAILCGMAALQSGAGLVTVACPETIQDTVAAGFPCYTTLGLPVDAQGELSSQAADILSQHTAHFDSVAVGPGLGSSDGAALTVRSLLKHVTVPIVLDADALNVLAPLNDELTNRQSPTVVTPHPGEFARLTGSTAPRSDGGRLCAANAFAGKHRCVLLLKGNGTVIADGTRHRVNMTGNPGMATGGSGDVLTGIIAALIGQGLSPFDAASLGAHVHGLAGDAAAANLGMIAMTALDIVKHLPVAFRAMSAAESES